jgi:3'(2'), 5'-bisphosphate nucleotidase
MGDEKLLLALLDVARAASQIVMRIYAEPDFGVELKGPNDPVTRADKEANAFLVDRLSRMLPGVPIVAEESDPSSFVGFEAAPAALFVDPVDGTREFVARIDEFAVMVGLAEEGRATAGVVVCPAVGAAFAGALGTGAFVIAVDPASPGDARLRRIVDGDGSDRRPIHVATRTDLAEARCAVSRFRRSKTVEAKLASLGVRELIPTGSAGVKGVRVASGEIDMFAHPSTGPVKLWDACAPEAIVRAAGGIFSDATGRPYDYRGALAQGAGCVAANPILHAEAVRRFMAPSGEDAQR